MPTTTFTGAFSQPDAEATPWPDTERVLADAELYWLTTVRADGRPHVTPLIGVWRGETAYFCTGHDEQKSRNLAHAGQVALTTGGNRWDAGHDVVVEGTATRVTDHTVLEQLAAAYVEKYGEEWRFEVEGDGFTAHGNASGVWAVRPTKVLSFAKDPHAQTTYRF